MKALFVAWQNTKDRNWVPVGRLTRENDVYKFVYTKGAGKHRDFIPFGHMAELNKVYKSEALFPIFANRILAKNRPEYEDYLQWLGLNQPQYDELDELSRTGGLRATDSLELFPYPTKTVENKYEMYFFCRGLRYMHPENHDRACKLFVGEKLYLMHDLQNAHDNMALLMRTGDPITLVGYAPRYYSKEFMQLIKKTGPEQVVITVEQINIDAPVQYRVLCKMVSPWPLDFIPFSTDDYQPLS